MASELAEKFMHTLQAIESSKDVEPLVALFASDAEVSNLLMTEPLTGQEGARQFWQKYLSVFDQIHSEFTHVAEGGHSIALEWTSTGTLISGEPIKYRGVSLIERHMGQVQRFRTYYDSAAFLPEGSKHS
ncbi:MAG: nuclear transport factor 2 family protein [Microcoleus sp. SIO2G3]|nr:nuclear transport factor 2 family protein [Microcoleus sp. SIO2G3]